MANNLEELLKKDIEKDIMSILFYKDQTFVGLLRELTNRGYKVIGTQVILSADVVGGVWWVDLSEELRDAIFNLMESGVLKVKHTTPARYNEEMSLKMLPVRKLNRENLKKTFVWVPVVLSSVERIEGLTPKESKFLY